MHIGSWACWVNFLQAENQMPWWQFALLGAGGGTIVEIVSIFRWVAVAGRATKR
jgi:hypothetical protein